MSKNTNKLVELFTVVDPDYHNTTSEVFCYFEDGDATRLDRYDLPSYKEYSSYDEYMHALIATIAEKTNSNVGELVELNKNGKFTLLDGKDYNTVRKERARNGKQSLDYSSSADERKKAKKIGRAHV